METHGDISCVTVDHHMAMIICAGRLKAILLTGWKTMVTIRCDGGTPHGNVYVCWETHNWETLWQLMLVTVYWAIAW